MGQGGSAKMTLQETLPLNLQRVAFAPDLLAPKQLTDSHAKYGYFGSRYGEEPKTWPQQKQLAVLQGMIQQELADLQVNGTILPTERVHILEPDVFSKRVSDNCRGIYLMADKLVLIADSSDKNAVMVTAAEEMLHAASYQQSGKLMRLGYNHGTGVKNFFYGLDEAAINMLKRDMFQKNLPYLTQELRLDSQQQKLLLHECSYNSVFQRYIACLERVINQASSVNCRSREEVVREFKRGLFEPSPQFFTTVQKTYGIEGLKMLACLGLGGINTPLDDLVDSYFQSRNNSYRVLN